MKRNREPTYVSLVFGFLCQVDDFFSVQQISAATGVPRKHVTNSLWALKMLYKAVDSVQSGQGNEVQLFWFATPDTDTRIRQIKEVVHGATRRSKPRKKQLPDIATTFEPNGKF
jgi:hypothetical protein